MAEVVGRKQWESAKEFLDSELVCIKTGSRRFGFATDDSDYDYCADVKNGGWQSWFKAYGFEQAYNEYEESEDEDTAEIWELRTKKGKGLWANYDIIQVVLSKDFENKQKIYEWLDKRRDVLRKYYDLPKKHRGRIWKMLMREAKEGNLG